MKNGQKVQGLKRWHTDIMPIAYAHFPSFLKKENQAKECSKKEQSFKYIDKCLYRYFDTYLQKSH
jgi:hypothetical protein